MMMHLCYYYMNLLRKLCMMLHELHYKIQLHKAWVKLLNLQH